MLSADEKERADRFHFSKDRERYVAARAALRRVLGSYLNIGAAQVTFSYNSFGKPELVRHHGPLRFNISHSREVAFVAVTSAQKVGIDLEFVDSNIDVLAIAKNSFSDLEHAELQSLPRHQRPITFFKAWTRKEAYLKARGVGFSGEGEIPFKLTRQEPNFCFHARESVGVPRWSVVSLHSGHDFSATVVVEGDVQKIRHRSLTKEAYISEERTSFT